MGQIFAGSSETPITAAQLRELAQAGRTMTQLRVPILQQADNPHEYLFLTFMDGSGQDVNNPKLGPPTNVGWLSEQAKALESKPELRIGTHYTKGIGAHDFALARWVDGALALSWDDGIKEMYLDLAKQARKWIDDDPDAQIRIAGVSYSRGAVQQAGLYRLIDQYGIANPDGLRFGRDAQGNLTVETKHAPLVPPGQVPQAAFLLDPVATNMPRNFDARLTPSTISRVAPRASNEGREFYPHHAIIVPGMADNNQSLNVPVPGGHANVGGGNRAQGVEIVVGNLAADYLNHLTSKPLFEKRAMPRELDAYLLSQAEGITAVWGLGKDRDGQRNLQEELANCKIVDPCRGSERVDQAMAAQFDYRHIPLDLQAQSQLQALATQAAARELAAAQANQHGMQQSQLLQQQTLQQQQAEAGHEQAKKRVLEATREQELREQEQNRTRAPLSYSHPDHPEHRMYATLTEQLAQRGQLSELSEAQLVAMAGKMHHNLFPPNWEGDAIVRRGRLFAQDVQGHRADLVLAEQVPAPEQTMRHVQAEDQRIQQAIDVRENERRMHPAPTQGQPGGPPLH